MPKEIVVQSKPGREEKKKKKKSRGLAVHILFSLFLLHLGMVISHVREEEKWETVAEIIMQL